MTSTHPPEIYSVVSAILPPDQLFGSLFHDVQMTHVFPDSITFADCYPKISPEEISSRYEIEKHEPDFKLIDFVAANFHIPKPIETHFASNQLLPASEHIALVWPLLTRSPEPDCSTLHVPNAYIVPGGRFRGLYYWDSYFTMLGLQAAGKHQPIRDMVDNFAYLVDAYGHIPNANRSYYLSRSQPPFFALMVRLLSEIDGPEILSKYLPHMQKEYNYWMNGHFRLSARERFFRRVVMMPDGSILNRYWDDLAAPRPESYGEDVELAHYLAPIDVEPGTTYRNIRAACESGWDFSCRWFKDAERLETIHTTDIIPVDLNCILYEVEVTLSDAYKQSAFSEPADYFLEKAKKRKTAMIKYFWNDEFKFFMDYDSEKNKSTTVLSLAGIFPLFCNIANHEQAEYVHTRVVGDFLHAGGVVTSLHESGQQWDFPNGWPPLQYITYKSLLNYTYSATAEELKTRWLALNDKVFRETGKMMEKYNVVDLDLPAGGGEYPNQDGFGWTNSIYLWMLNNPPVK